MWWVHARINFHYLSKFAQLQFANYNSVTAHLQFAQLQFAQLYNLVSTILRICLWNFQVKFLKYVSFEMSKKIDFCPLKNNSCF